MAEVSLQRLQDAHEIAALLFSADPVYRPLYLRLTAEMEEANRARFEREQASRQRGRFTFAEITGR